MLVSGIILAALYLLDDFVTKYQIIFVGFIFDHPIEMKLWLIIGSERCFDHISTIVEQIYFI